MEWNKLPMADRAQYIALGVQNGITSLDSIRKAYNSYAEGGKRYQVKNTKGELLGEFDSVEERDEFINNNDNLSWVEPDLKELVVAAKSPDSSAEELSDQEITRYLHNLDRTGSFDYANRVYKADRHASQYNAENMLGALTSGLNVLSPSTQVGATIDWLQEEKGYWEGIATNQSGFFPDEFSKEYPNSTLVGNLIGDAALSLGSIKPLSYKIKPLFYKNKPASTRVLNNTANTFYRENIRPKLISLGIDELDLPPLFHNKSHNGFNNLPIKVKKVKGINAVGEHNTITGENIISPTSGAKSIAIHEASSHGTDELIPKKVVNFYNGTIEELPDNNRLLRWIFGSKDSNKWYELRATKNEIEYYLKTNNIDIDNLTDKELAEILKTRNSYGKDYSLSIENPADKLNDSFGTHDTYEGLITNPDELGPFNTPYRRSKDPFLDRLRYAIKYLPAVSPAILLVDDE